jgi:glycosyltransferase involved in cell wall biosynthesis
MIWIKISDRGWIIEAMAKRLAEALPNVRYDLELPQTQYLYDLSLVYFLPYLTYEPVSIPVAAYFTHREVAAEPAKRFDQVAREATLAIAQSPRSLALVQKLRELSQPTIWIPPGVDLERFVPRLRIGIIGRTYDSGRKGEHLLRGLLDLAGVEFIVSGPGWPIPPTPIPEAELPAFYRSLDYVLITSTNEGGPMCVLEALACGVPVIGPAVGWVDQFPHIPYELGNLASLRQVLSRCLAEKQARRQAVLNYSWTRWIDAHRILFELYDRFPPRIDEARA